MQYNQHHGPSWLHGNVDEAIELLAVTATQNREKRAVLLTKHADPSWAEKTLLDPAANYIKNKVVQPIAGDITNSAMKHMGWGLAGAGIGGGLGLASQMFSPKKKRRPLSSFTTGALLGGAAGVGGSLVHSNWDAIRGIDKDTDQDKANAAAEAQAKLKQNIQASNSNADVYAKSQQWGLEPHRMQTLQESQRLGDPAVGRRDWLQGARRDNLGFRAHEGLDPALVAKMRPLSQKLMEPHGFNPADVEGLDPKNTATFDAFRQKVLTGNNGQPLMRTVTDAAGKATQTPWTPEELKKLDLEKLRDSVINAKGMHAFEQMDGGEDALKHVLDNITGDVKKTGYGTPTGRLANDLWNSKTQMGARMAKGDITGMAELTPASWLAGKKNNKGVFDALDRSTSGFSSMTDGSQQDIAAQAVLKGKGFTPTELLMANKQGPAALDALVQQAIAQKRMFVGPDGQQRPWTAEQLQAEMPGMVAGVRDAIGDDRGVTPWLAKNMPSTGNATSDLLLGGGAVDAAGTLRSFLRGGNPDVISKAIREGKLPADVLKNPSLMATLEHANSEPGGIAKLMKDPEYYTKRLTEIEKALAGDVEAQARLRPTRTGMSGWIENKVLGKPPTVDELRAEYGRLKPLDINNTVSNQTINQLFDDTLKSHRAANPPKVSLGILENKLIELRTQMGAYKDIGMNRDQLKLLFAEVDRIKSLPPEFQHGELTKLLTVGARDTDAALAAAPRPKGVKFTGSLGVSVDPAVVTSHATGPKATLPTADFARMVLDGKVPLDPHMAAGIKGIDAKSLGVMFDKALTVGADPNEVHVLPNGSKLTTDTLKAIARQGGLRASVPGIGGGGLPTRAGKVLGKIPRGGGMLGILGAGHLLFDRGGMTPQHVDEYMQKQQGK